MDYTKYFKKGGWAAAGRYYAMHPNKLKELFSKRYVAEPAKIATNSVDEEFLKKAVSFIENNFENENYGVDDFVSDMAIGRTRLYQKLNDLTGLSIKEFILDIRLKRASQLLRETEYNIAEISTMTGFASPKYFSVCFKRHFGHNRGHALCKHSLACARRSDHKSVVTARNSNLKSALCDALTFYVRKIHAVAVRYARRLVS